MRLSDSARFSGEGNPLTITYGDFTLSIWTSKDGYSPSKDSVKVSHIQRILIEKGERVILDISAIHEDVNIDFSTIEGTLNFFMEKNRKSQDFYYMWLDRDAELLAAFVSS